MMLLPIEAKAELYVLAFGDSITHGIIDAEGVTTLGYEPVLASELNNNGVNAEVLNYGSSGEDTGYGLGRLQRVLGGNTYLNYVLILEGVNDLDAGISEQTTIFNLKQMVAAVRSAGMIPIISNLLPDNLELGNQVPTVYNPDIHSMATSNSVLFADNYSAVASNWSALTRDGRHPNQAGYNLMAPVWYNAMAGGSASDPGSGSSSTGGGGGGCFIATAAFGSQLEARVVLLQQFRDAFLLTNKPGTVFVHLYYKYSPPIADFIRERGWLKAIVRVCLYPLIGFSYLMLHHIISWTSVIWGMALLVLAGIFWPLRRKLRLLFMS
jgi:lysophospholipase L1-like esterase